MILVTGGCGFIGSNFILNWLETKQEPLINIDALTYAGNPENLKHIQANNQYHFIQGNICDRALIRHLLDYYQPRAIIHFAAESHVDRSISDPQQFINTNIIGTFTLLEACRNYWTGLASDRQQCFRFLHVSTDEVFGSLEKAEPAFNENNAYKPNSPYSASKAASDHLVRAWHHTYGLPVLTTNCSNNYGPYQFPEKLIPFMLSQALAEKPLTIYGDGQNIRDWLYVVDHCRGIETVLEKGRLGETYNIGGYNELTNLEVVNCICQLLDELCPRARGSYSELISFIKDRPGHDRRYAIDAQKINKELHWVPRETFASGIRKTIIWYLENQSWIENILSGHYHSSTMQHQMEEIL